MTPSLEALDRQFFEIATQKLTDEEKEFIASKWPQLRNYACQNAGLRKWGRHMLYLDNETCARVDDAFRFLVKGIEMEGFQLWKGSSKDPHMEAIFRLFFDDQSSLKDVDFSMKEKLALFWKYDASIISQYRERFEQIFRDLYHQMVWKQHDRLATELLFGNLIALYPLFDPPSGHQVHLLQLIEGEWTLVLYRTEPISLVDDKVLAYGLTPMDNSKALPLILFCGTPYPAAKGFWQALESDFDPFHSVGEVIFQKGVQRINGWMNQKPQVKCYGLSLGGALAYHLGKAYGSRVEIYAYVPPGLFTGQQDMLNIHGAAYYHLSDLVPFYGYHPAGKHFNCYGVITEANRNLLIAHARPMGCNPMLIIEINSLYSNKSPTRHLLTILKHILSAVGYLLLLPFRLLIKAFRSLYRLIWKKN